MTRPRLAARGVPSVAARRLFWPIAAATAVSAAFFAIAAVRFATYHSSAYDLAFFDQVVWNGAQGNGLRSSFLAYPFLGQHFEPVLYLFIPLYRFHATPLWLLGAQSLALGAAVVPLAGLARRWVGATWQPIAVCAAYVLQVGIARAVGFDFHTETLAVPFVFFALLGAARGDTRLLLLAGMVPMLCKEDGALVTLGIAVLALLVCRRRAALALGAIAVVGGAVVVLSVMPQVRGGASGDLVARYAYLGGTPGAIVLHVFTEPGVWVAHLLSPSAGLALLTALAAVGFLPLLRPLALLGTAPALLLSLMADDTYQSGLRLHYAVQATPLLVAAAMLGWQNAAARWRAARALPARALIGGAVATWLALSPLPGGRGPDGVQIDGLARAGAVDGLLQRIPAGDSVAASGDLLTHLAERSVIAEFPNRHPVQWVAIDGEAQVSAQSRAAGYTDTAAHLAQHGYVLDGEASSVSLWRRASNG